MKNFFYRSVFINFFLFVSLLGNAQSKASVKTSVDKNKILIGERFSLTAEIKFPSKENIQFRAIDSIPHFEIVSKEKIDTLRTDKETKLRQVIHLTSFDSGHWYIPSFYFNKKIKTDSIPVDVVFSDFDPQKPYHDIKEIIEVNPIKEKEWWWYAVIGAALLAGLLIILFKRKKRPVVTEIKTIDPFKEAMLELEKLRKENISVQQFYTDVVNTFRLYIFRKKGIQSLQKTTDDLIAQLRSINVDKKQFEKLSEALRLSDAVKFAKYIPMQEDNKIALENIKGAIQSIEQMS